MKFRTVSFLVRDAWRATQGGPEAIEKRQKERLHGLVAYTRTRSRFYAQAYHGVPRSVADIRGLPVVTKAALMARFEDWVTDPEVTRASVEAFAADPSKVGAAFLGRYTVWTTSGTTGTPALLVQDERAIAVMLALGLARALPAWIGREEVVSILTRRPSCAIVFATGGHFMALTMAERALRQSRWFRRMAEVIPVTTPLPELVARLNRLNPAVLASYASGLILLAEEQAAGRLAIDPVLLISTGELLAPSSRERVQAIFKQRVCETYGASEIQIAAFECAQGRLHVNSDWVILEPVDEEYRPVEPGIPSFTVLATSLANRVQPVIRYDLGDRLTVFPDSCACGSPLQAIQVEGRTDEILTFLSPVGEAVRLLPTALTTSIAEIPHLYRFQLIRKGSGKLLVRFEATDDPEAVWKEIEAALRRVLDNNRLTNILIERAIAPPSPMNKAGKLRQVWSEDA